MRFVTCYLGLGFGGAVRRLWVLSAVAGMGELTQPRRQLHQNVDREKAAEQQKRLNQPVGPGLEISSSNSPKKNADFEIASKQLSKPLDLPRVGILILSCQQLRPTFFKVTSDPSERSPTRRSQDGSGNKSTHNPKVYGRWPRPFNEKAEHK